MKLVNTDQMRQIDRETIDNRNIPGEVLMENAGAGIALRILETVIDDASGASAAIFCGKGNNGGDGYVIARHLHTAGVDTEKPIARGSAMVGRKSGDFFVGLESANIVSIGERLLQSSERSLHSLALTVRLPKQPWPGLSVGTVLDDDARDELLFFALIGIAGQLPR